MESNPGTDVQELVKNIKQDLKDAVPAMASQMSALDSAAKAWARKMEILGVVEFHNRNYPTEVSSLVVDQEMKGDMFKHVVAKVKATVMGPGTQEDINEGVCVWV